VSDIAVELLDACKRYGDTVALKGLSMRVGAGEVVAMLGPNGAGKTTAISLMLGLRRPTSGRVRVFGLDPADRRARGRCGVMLQESGVPGSLRVSELVTLFRSYYPRPLSTARALEAAGLTDLARSPAAKLSGGQRQRLNYALAICGDPDILLLDEPTVGMDFDSRRAFMASIQSFAGAGKTVLFTTHYLEEADQLAERIAVIDRGVLVADASPSEIKSRVAGRRVTFECEPPLSRADLEGLPWSRLDLDGRRVRILSNQPEAILGELFRRRLRLRDLEVTSVDLEEAFLTLTSRPEPAATELVS
jgi:ABC-2 type transport system ATP-binding protein